MSSILIWSLAAFVAAVYCLFKAVADLRSRRYVAGLIGLLSALVFLATPIGAQTGPVKIDLPVRSR